MRKLITRLLNWIGSFRSSTHNHSEPENLSNDTHEVAEGVGAPELEPNADTFFMALVEASPDRAKSLKNFLPLLLKAMAQGGMAKKDIDANRESIKFGLCNGLFDLRCDEEKDSWYWVINVDGEWRRIGKDMDDLDDGK